MSQKVIIIGAGIGGITTALYLAQRGFQVEIFEKNAQSGGRCSQLEKDGHRFDLGATILLMPSIYREVFESLSLNMDSFLETTSLNPIYKIFYNDGSAFDFSPNDEQMRIQLERIETGSYTKYKSYISEGYDFFKKSMTILLNKNYNHIFQFINFQSLLLLVHLKVWKRHTNYIYRFFTDHRLRKAFTFQNIYVGQNPYQQPAFFSMLPAAEITESALFPKGGMGQIAQKLLDKALKEGIKIHYNQSVKEIIIENRKATGILCEDGSRTFADIIVANADLPYVYSNLLPINSLSKRLNNKEYSCSAIVFHWAMSKQFPQFEHHSIFLNEPYKHGMDMIFNNKTVSNHPSFYVHSPTRTDTDAAPLGEDTLSIIVPVGHIDQSKNQDWKDITSKTRQNVVNCLQNAGITEIEKHIKFEITFTPLDFENYCHVARGSVFGSIGHTLFQMGWFRPHNRHRKYKNLYFVGGSTHPGNGVPLVLLGAKLVGERIIKEMK